MDTLPWKMICIKAVITFLLCMTSVPSSSSYEVSELPDGVEFPPKMRTYEDQEVPFRTDGTSDLKLHCKAEANPDPLYYWEKNGTILDPANDYPKLGIEASTNSGDIMIQKATVSSVGVYQCFAKNVHGVAVSVKTTVRATVFTPFAKEEVKQVTLTVGDYTMLKCDPPFSYPAADIDWVFETEREKIETYVYNDRVTMDYDGNLHFANTQEGDDMKYLCSQSNSFLNGIFVGAEAELMLTKIATIPARQPERVWDSGTTTIALENLSHRMKCIFKGFPTPKVTWTRLEKALVDGRMAEPEDGYGMEFVINPVKYQDSGKYRCRAENSEGHDDITFHLVVEAAPFWDREPEDVHAAEDEDAELKCEPSGTPAPNITWNINGVPSDKADYNKSRITIEKNVIRFKQVAKTDTATFQCNASNVHGYSLRNMYINVLALKPSISKYPPSSIKVAEGAKVEITCEVFGAPEPVVNWVMGVNNKSVNFNEERYTLHSRGSLTISEAKLSDKGYFYCIAINKLGNASASGTLIVRAATEITSGPQDKDVMAGEDVEFKCEAKTDPEEMGMLEISWLKNGEKINFNEETRLRLNTEDNSLVMNSVNAKDTNEYTCVASNGIEGDEATMTAKLTVRDKPDPPHSLALTTCRSQSATFSWEAGSDNNSPITEYIVYYNTSFDKELEYTEFGKVDAPMTDINVEVSPWANYTFHVKAVNAYGTSDPSEFSKVCNTNAARPVKNPTGVCTESRGENQLVIVWDKIEQIDHNGEGFHYEVNYRLHDAALRESEDPEVVMVNDWKQTELVVDDVESFTEYEIWVVSVNKEGSVARVHKMIGYSGEGVPKASPSDLQIVAETLNATHVKMTWKGLDSSLINGLFTGYEIHYWKADDDDSDVKIHDVPRAPGKFCRSIDSHRTDTRKRRQSGQEETIVPDLWPYSEISAGVLVKNNKHKGALSDPPISFTTPEGVPSMVRGLEAYERGSNHFALTWQVPEHPNGIIQGYNLRYQVADDSSSPVFTVTHHEKSLKTKIKELKSSTRYSISMSAITNKGQGPEMRIEEMTTAAGPPAVPAFSDLEVGDNYVNVSWVPSEDEDAENPGAEFFVEYRKVMEDGETEWESSTPEEFQRWANVSDLDYGETYEIRIVALNGQGDRSESKIKRVRVGSQPDERIQQVRQSVATAGWFIGMMCAIILLLIILLIVCLIKRNRGGKYPVHEKEKLRGHDPDDEEGGFGEYTKADAPKMVNHGPGFDDEKQPLDGSDDDDSLAEYDQMDPSKFNEDGSFIGQYGGKSKSDKEDMTSPSALSTFV